ncbi:MAG: serine hydrolase domain-containing protein [Betaproteobacteria bacterium]
MACALVAGGAQAEGAPSPAPQALTESDLAAFVDGILPIEMARAGIDGAAVAVVKDGHVLLARGYGVADRERQVPVSTDATLFRVASISKLFTWTAVMQLAEQHRLDLDADVQQYLDFPLPPAFGAPVTLRRLMTHTAGFEETVQGMWAQEGESLLLRDYVVAHVPARIFAPGSVGAYSNYGATLAGYIVQRRSGEPFDAYVARHILQPLGMAHSTFAQPLPASLAPLMSRGYRERAEPAQPFELIRVAPAGALSTSAADMARFMLAELGDGGLDGQRILQSGTLAQMQSAQYWPHPLGPAMALGFWEDGGYAQRVIGHGGDSQWFHSGLYLLPAQRVGVFIVQNTLGKHLLRDAFFGRFMARYFPAPPAVFPPGPPPAAAIAGIAGRYVSSRRGESGALRLGTLLSQTEVRVDESGRLTDSDVKGLDDRLLTFRWLGDGVWQSPEDPTRRLYFRRGTDGLWSFSGRVPVFIDQQVRWTRDARLLAPLLFASLFVLAATLLAWPLAAAARWHFAPRARASERHARQALRWAAMALLLPWLLIGGTLVSGVNAFEFIGGPWAASAMRVVQAAAWLGLGATLLAAWAAQRQWRAAGVWWWARVHATLVVAAGLGASLLAWQGHLLVGATIL